MGIISNLTEACSEPTNEIIINNKNKVNKMNNKDILYLSYFRNKNLYNKTCVISSENIETFFQSEELFNVEIKKNNRVPLKLNEDFNSLFNKNYYYYNIHISNFFQNKNYALIYLQCDINEIQVDSPKFLTENLNLFSKEPEQIKEILYTNFKEKLKNKYILKGIVEISSNLLYLIYQYDGSINYNFDDVDYYIEIFESNFKIISQEEIKNILNKNNNKMFICSFNFEPVKRAGNNFFFIFLDDNNDFINNKYNIFDNFFVIKRENDEIELYLKRLAQNIGKKGKIISTIDTIELSYIFYNNND
jgi:hypothetical protein